MGCLKKIIFTWLTNCSIPPGLLQNIDGGWGLHIEGNSIMFCTALNYVTLRLLGEKMDGGDGAMGRARKWILDHGGATYIPSWGKLWLSVRYIFPFFFGFFCLLELRVY